MIKLCNMSYADTIYDKLGREVYEVLIPTAESTIDENTISYAERRIVEASDGSDGYEGPNKNIFSKGILITDTTQDIKNNDYTLIRHTPSITNLDEEKYEIIEDRKRNRIRIHIYTTGGIIEAKNGFFQISDKKYYFDKMV